MRKKLYLCMPILLILTLAACSGKTDELDTSPEVDGESAQSSEPEPEQKPENSPVSAEVATPTAVSIHIDGCVETVNVYEIGEETFYHLRDIAYLVKDTPAKFEVKQDQTTDGIALFSGQQYTETGSELTAVKDDSVVAWSNTAPILLDGKELECDAFLIDGEYFLKLRDVGKAVNFSVGWSNVLGQVLISTSKSSSEEPITLEEEYQMIVDGQPIYEEGMDGLWDTVVGLCYADMVDFDADGTPELLLISAKPNEGELTTYSVSVEVYGAVEGCASKYGTPLEFTWDSGEKSLSLVESNGKVFLHHYTWGGGAGTPQTYTYYNVDAAAISEVDNVSSWNLGWADDGSGEVWVYLTGDVANEQEISAQEFEETVGKYATRASIVSFSEGNFYPRSYGILPEPKKISVEVNGEMVEFDDKITVVDAHVIAPIGPVLEKMGVPLVTNTANTRMIASTKSDTLDIYDLYLGWGDISGVYVAEFNDEAVAFFDMNAQMRDGKIVAPIKAVVQLFGGTGTWDGMRRTLVIQSNIPATNQMTLAEVQSLMDFSLDEAERIAANLGYVSVFSPDGELSAFSGYRDGKAYWWLTALPPEISEDYAESLYDIGIDKYEVVTVWSDGAVTFGFPN